MASASEILKAYLHCARTPAEDAVERIRTQLKKQYGAAEVELTVSVEPDLISGYVLQVGDRVFDNSGKSALAAIRSLPLTTVQRAWWKAWSPIIWASCCLTRSRKWAWALW